MYLPALKEHPGARVTAVCGRNPERTKQFATRWGIPHPFTHYQEMLASGLFDVLIVATRNDSHYPISMDALQSGLHVLCEKPLALNYAQAAEMADLAERRGLKTMVPFTYRYMPTSRYVKELLDEGYIGRPYHLNMRYYTGYGRDGEYLWRFDAGKAGSGAIGDIGSHFLYLAEWYFGPVTRIGCQLGRMVKRPLLDPYGRPYEQGDDTAVLMLTFANGAQGVIHLSTVAYEDSPFGQTHQMEFHGSEGTLYHFIDWERVQRVSGARQGEGMVRELPLPEHIWGKARRDTLHNTYRDVFRKEDFMTRAFVTAVLEDKAIRPDFRDGARIQKLVDLALASDSDGCWKEVL